MKQSSTSQKIINCERRIKELRVKLKNTGKKEEMESLMSEIKHYNDRIDDLKLSLKIKK